MWIGMVEVSPVVVLPWYPGVQVVRHGRVLPTRRLVGIIHLKRQE